MPSTRITTATVYFRYLDVPAGSRAAAHGGSVITQVGALTPQQLSGTGTAGARPPNQPDVVPCSQEAELVAATTAQALGSKAGDLDTGGRTGDVVDSCAASATAAVATEEALAAALAAAAAEAKASSERERLLKADGERRELENARLRCEGRRLSNAAMAMATLLQYTTDELHAFSTPWLRAQNNKLTGQLADAALKIGALEAELSLLAETSQRDAANSASRLHQLQDEHASAMSVLYAQVEEVKTVCSKEIDQINAKATEEKSNLQNQLLVLEKERDELRNQYKRVEDALMKDANVKVQLALSPYKHLPKEVESLMTVVDLKNAEIQKLRAENNENKKQLEELWTVRERASVLEQRAESLAAALEARVRSERELLDRHDELVKRYERESRENLRLSMNCEELQYRLQDVTLDTSLPPVASPQARSLGFPSPRAPTPACMTTSLYEPLTASSPEMISSVKMRRSLSSSSAAGGQRRRKLSYDKEASPVSAAPPSTPSVPEQQEAAEEVAVCKATDAIPEVSSAEPPPCGSLKIDTSNDAPRCAGDSQEEVFNFSMHRDVQASTPAHTSHEEEQPHLLNGVGNHVFSVQVRHSPSTETDV